MTVYDASSNTVYAADLPQDKTAAGNGATARGPARSTRSTRFLAELGAALDRLGAPTRPTPAGQPAYTVERLAEARRRPARLASSSPGTPCAACRCEIAVYAQGASSPVLALDGDRHLLRLRARRADVDVAPPAGAKVVDSRHRRRPRRTRPEQAAPSVSGLDAVQAAAAVPRSSRPTRSSACRARTCASSATTRRSSLYGHGLGGDRRSSSAQADAAQRRRQLVQLPTVSLDGADRARARDAARHGARLAIGPASLRARRLAAARRRRGRGARAAVSDAPPVAARGLVKRYGEIVAVDHVDLTVERGDVFGYLGPNGAGKTTSLRMLLGLIRPTAGTRAAVRPRSARRGRAGPRRRRRLRRGPALLPVPLRPPQPRAARRLRRAGVPRRASRRCSSWSSCATARKDRVGGYSHGMQQRLGIAASLLRAPAAAAARRADDRSRPGRHARHARARPRLAGEGITILLSSHLLAEVEELCNRVAIIRSGRIIYEGSLVDAAGRPPPAATGCARSTGARASGRCSPARRRRA